MGFDAWCKPGEQSSSGSLDESDWFLRESQLEVHDRNAVPTLFTVSNGFIGVRGSREEEVGDADTLLGGLFDQPESMNPDDEPRIVVRPSWFAAEVAVDAPERPAANRHASDERVLDMEHGSLLRDSRYELGGGDVLSIRTMRLAHRSSPRLLLQRMKVVLAGRAWRLSVRLPLRMTSPVGSDALEGDGVVIRGESFNGRSSVQVAQRARLFSSQGWSKRATIEVRGELAHRFDWRAEASVVYSVERIVERMASEGSRSLVSRIGAILNARRTALCEAGRDRPATADGPPRGIGFDALLERHRVRWGERWRAADVVIEGDLLSQRALRFAIYHLISAVATECREAMLPSRGLTGTSHAGHVFWETEIYACPFFVFTHPKSARALLEYRYRTLDAARAKARALGFAGALFPWEGADEGIEVTPAHDGAGKPILTRTQGHHVSADVARAVLEYEEVTDDREFMEAMGMELLAETARFWASRVESGSDGFLHIRGVVGPDEYHPAVDDSVFTNVMARHNLLQAGRAAARLRRADAKSWRSVAERLGLSPSELDHWAAAARRIAVLRAPGTPRFEQFLGYDRLVLEGPSRHASARGGLQASLGLEYLSRTQLIKQPDVVTLCHVLRASIEEPIARANLLYYEPRADPGGSSLGPCIHAAVAARTGELALARRYWERALDVDLGRDSAAADGIHIGACGGLWQAAVFGFGGVLVGDRGLSLSPRLLPEWRALRFPIRFRGHELHVAVDKTGVEVEHREGDAPLDVHLFGERRRLLPGARLGTSRQSRCGVGA
jgi:kojibiose phosphorylase